MPKVVRRYNCKKIRWVSATPAKITKRKCKKQLWAGQYLRAPSEIIFQYSPLFIEISFTRNRTNELYVTGMVTTWVLCPQDL
jgi:hypothetical protein